jgi:hypothetical protein
MHIMVTVANLHTEKQPRCSYSSIDRQLGSRVPPNPFGAGFLGQVYIDNLALEFLRTLSELASLVKYSIQYIDNLALEFLRTLSELTSLVKYTVYRQLGSGVPPNPFGAGFLSQVYTNSKDL